jgi:hypothetical protein
MPSIDENNDCHLAQLASNVAILSTTHNASAEIAATTVSSQWEIS